MTQVAPPKFEVWSPVVRRNPHPVYAQMRAEAPICQTIGPVSGNTFWFFTRYDDCVNVLRDDRFGKDFRAHLPPELLEQYGQPDPFTAAIEKHLLNLDPPDHTRLRQLVHKAFTARMIENLRPRIAEIAADLIATIRAKQGDSIDLIADFAFPLPIIVICELLGIPSEERNDFGRWSRTILFGTDMNATGAAVMEVLQYLNEIFEARRAHPKDDLITALLQTEEAGDVLDRQELISMIFLLLVAGHETTVNLIGNGMLALMQNPDQKALLLARPELNNSAVEEMLRFGSPVENALSRWAYEDVILRGQTIKQGDVIFATLAAANRDPEVFTDPDRFDITRTPNKHIAFGGGIHFCLGAPLARMEGQIAIPALLAQFPQIELAIDPDQLVWANQILLRGVATLPVTV